MWFRGTHARMDRAIGALVLVLLCACGGGAAPPATTPAPAAPAPVTETPTPAPGARFGFVLLAGDAMPGAQAVIDAYAAIAPGAPPLVADGAAEPHVQSFRLDGQLASIGLIGAPVPGGEAEAHAQHSLSALGDGWSPAPHRAHLLVMLVPDDRGARASMRDLTRLLAAAAQASDAVGVYLGPATHEPRFFVEAVRELEDPVPVWIGFSLAAEAGDRGSILSRGMDQLGLPDLLLTVRKDDVAAGIAYFFDVIEYVIDRGAPIPDGDTVGRTADEKLVVRYEPSPIDPEAKVWRIDLP